jgi:hypothetical protein
VALLADITVTKSLNPAEVYVVLLLLLRIPVLRLVAVLFDLVFCVPRPRMSRDDVSDSFVSLALLTIDVGLSLWFWSTGVQVGESGTNCPQVGFLFVKVNLTTPWFKTVNVVFLTLFYLAALCLAWRRVSIGRGNKPRKNSHTKIKHSKAKFPCFIN